jgi:hypothetical protein
VKKILPIGVILAVAIFVAFYSFKQWFYPNPNPRDAFAQLVANPVPNSVDSIQQGNFITLDSVFRVLRFQIDKTDLKVLLDSQHFTPIDENEEFKQWDQNSKGEIKIQKENYLAYWKQRIQRTVKLDVNFTKTWQIFTLKEGHGQKYFFFDTNSTEAVFVAEVN